MPRSFRAPGTPPPVRRAGRSGGIRGLLDGPGGAVPPLGERPRAARRRSHRDADRRRGTRHALSRLAWAWLGAGMSRHRDPFHRSVSACPGTRGRHGLGVADRHAEPRGDAGDRRQGEVLRDRRLRGNPFRPPRGAVPACRDRAGPGRRRACRLAEAGHGAGSAARAGLPVDSGGSTSGCGRCLGRGAYGEAGRGRGAGHIVELAVMALAGAVVSHAWLFDRMARVSVGPVTP